MELYATYYQLQTLRVPRGLPEASGEPIWDKIRAVADETLFGKQKQEIRFAALSLDGSGLANYGDCTLVLREEMIAHRASAIEENSLIFMDRHDIKVWRAAELPKGYRSTWRERDRLCVAKLCSKLAANTTSRDFPGILLRQGATSLEDEFIEVHVFGPVTIRTVWKVVLHKKQGRRRRAKLKAMQQVMSRWDVVCETQK